MTEVAALSLTAQSNSLVVATEELHDLAAAARVAQDAADDMATGVAAGGVRVGQMGRAAKVAGASAFQASGGMRMMGLQMSQVVQQAAAGGSIFQALAIQAADIGAMFGGVGVVLGILATVAIPVLAAAFSGMSEQATEDAKRVKEAWESLGDAARDVQTEIDKIRMGVDEKYQVDLLREQLRLRGEIGQKVTEISATAATLAGDERARAQYIADANVELDQMGAEYNRITAELSNQENRTTQLAILDGIRAQRAGENAARQEQAAAAMAKAQGFAQTIAGLYAVVATKASELYRNTAAAQGAGAALAGISFGNISLAANWAANLAANMRAAAQVQTNMMSQGQTTGSTTWFWGQTADSLLPPTPGLAPPLPSGGGGGGGGISDRQSKLDDLIGELETEREALTNWYNEKLALIQTYSDLELKAVGGRQGAIERLEAEHLQRLRDLRDGYQGDTLSQMGTFFGDMEAALQSGNAGMLRVAKVFGAAEALVNAYRAGAQVMADPTLPWWRKIPAALSVVAAGVGMANAIKGGGSGGGARANRSAGVTTAPAQTAAPQDVIIDFSATMNPAMRALAEALLGPMVQQLQKVSKTGVNVVAVKY